MLIAAVSEMAVLRALQLAGNRIIGARGRSVRGPMKSVEPWSIHVHLRVEEQELDAFLKDAWQIPIAVGLPDDLLDALDTHPHPANSRYRVQPRRSPAHPVSTSAALCTAMGVRRLLMRPSGRRAHTTGSKGC